MARILGLAFVAGRPHASEWRVTRIFWERMASSSLFAALDVFKPADSEGREEKTSQILYPCGLVMKRFLLQKDLTVFRLDQVLHHLISSTFF